MVFIKERKIKGKIYIYLEKSVRINKKVLKISKYLGRKEDLSIKKIKTKIKDFRLEIDKRLLNLILKEAKKKYLKLEYPLDIDALKEIEEMNLKYYEIKKTLNRNDWFDLKRRFIANFVFESNALEGNSLTLKNFSEIVFENRIDSSADLRDVYDAQNSYKVFSSLLTMKKDITEEFIINIHRRIIKNIDDRLGYKKTPNILLGRNIKLAQPQDVKKEMEKLINWYEKNKEAMYPLELASKFHHKFEKIHPFSDGNGRVGRLLLNYILILNNHYPIIIRKTNRSSYLKSLEAADNGKYILLIRFVLEKTKDTYRKFFETYYKYI